MRWAPFLLGLLLIAGACVVEDKQLVPPIEGGVEAGVCVLCPADRPVCLDDSECVQCTLDEQEYCSARDQVCDTEAHECVDCLDNAQCTAPTASRCDSDTNECAPCETNADCDGVDGLGATGNACDADEVCVACTPDSEAQTCPDGKSCNPRTNTCTETTIGSRDVCEACVADSECGDDGEPSDAYKCVPMYYPDTQTRFPDEETGFCLKTFAPGGCEQPFAIQISGRPSLSDLLLGSYCGINESLATCPAVRALVENATCPSGEDAECPTSGVCRDVGGLPDRCTYFCSDVVECKDAPVPGSTCGSSGSGGDDYCGG
ncbi:MAG: hypothetical protein JRE81_02565 [Deltaproteobacteria bacterium]|nr:hypothetical protein [Deltaproteobacteria bacterium]